MEEPTYFRQPITQKIPEPSKEEVEQMRETLIAFGRHDEHFYSQLNDREVDGYYKRHMQMDE